MSQWPGVAVAIVHVSRPGKMGPPPWGEAICDTKCVSCHTNFSDYAQIGWGLYLRGASSGRSDFLLETELGRRKMPPVFLNPSAPQRSIFSVSRAPEAPRNRNF